MAMLTVRNLPDEVHRALRVRAARRGHSMEAEVREILESAISPQGRVRLGSMLVVGIGLLFAALKLASMYWATFDVAAP